MTWYKVQDLNLRTEKKRISTKIWESHQLEVTEEGLDLYVCANYKMIRSWQNITAVKKHKHVLS